MLPEIGLTLNSVDMKRAVEGWSEGCCMKTLFCCKYGQVGYPWNDLAKCNSEALTLCQWDPPVKSYNQISFLPDFPIVITMGDGVSSLKGRRHIWARHKFLLAQGPRINFEFLKFDFFETLIEYKQWFCVEQIQTKRPPGCGRRWDFASKRLEQPKQRRQVWELLTAQVRQEKAAGCYPWTHLTHNEEEEVAWKLIH